MSKKFYFILIPFLTSGLLIGLSFLRYYQDLEWKVYDLFLLMMPVQADTKSIVLLEAGKPGAAKNIKKSADTDHAGIARSVLAAGLILLKEFDARYAVVNQEFDTESLYEHSPKQLAEVLKSILFSGEQGRQGEDLFKQLEKTIKDDDQELAQAARFFGNTYLGMKLLETTPGSEAAESGNASGQADIIQYTFEKASLHNLEVIQDTLPAYPGIEPVIFPIFVGAKGSGFINYTPEPDGTIRRVGLIKKYKDYYIPELGFAALLDWLGNPRVVLLKDQLILKNAQISHVEKDIKIPLAEDKNMFIPWAGYETKEKWRSLFFEELTRNNQLEEKLLYQLNLMQAKGYVNVYQKQAEWISLYAEAAELLKEMLATGSTEALNDYRAKRKAFLAGLQNFLEEETEQTVMQKMKEALSSGQLSQSDVLLYEAIQPEIPEDFRLARELYEQLSSLRKTFSEYLPDSFCLIGSTVSDSLGVSSLPFERKAGPVAVQAHAINAILAGRFLTYLPWWYASLSALLLSLTVTLIALNLKTRGVLWLGSMTLLLIILGSIMLFISKRIFLNPLNPLLTISCMVALILAGRFSIHGKKKNFLKQLFFTSLSKDSWDELLKNGTELLLHGEQKKLTAFYSEIRDFALIAHKLGPQELVNFLNIYLTEISNLVLEQNGTINKFDKSRLMSFFGLPVPLPDQARRACLAAIRIKKAEKSLGERLAAGKMAFAPLVSHTGISTGEMTVGNLGTLAKIDYTAVGPPLSLALHLKKLNHYYGTQILIEETTYVEGGYDFYVRMLDKVRMAGIMSPVRIYELIDEKHRVDSPFKEGIEFFHEGMYQFEKKEWEKAEKIFQKVLRIIPKDYPAAVYYKRCQKYRQEPPAANWTNVFNLK